MTKIGTGATLAALLFAQAATGGEFGATFGDDGRGPARQFDAALPWDNRYTLYSEFALRDARQRKETEGGARRLDGDGVPAGLATFSAGTPGSSLHFSSAWDGDERQFGLGFSTRSSTFSVIAGDGDSRTGLFSLYRGIDPYLFHGGGQEPFSYRGAVFSHSFTDATSALLGRVELRSPGLEERDAWVAGFDSGRYFLTYSSLARGGGHIANAAGFGYGGERIGLDYQYLGGVSGAEAHRLGLDLYGGKSRKLRLELQSARNPLFRAKDENRLLLSFTAPWGGAPAMRVGDEEGRGDPKATGHNRMRTAAIVAGGAAAVAVLASSGSAERDSTPRYTRQHEAAYRVVNRINPRSVRENREYGGWVYRNGDGSYGSTAPVRGTYDSVNLGIPGQVVPSGTVATASYHTHGAFDPRYDNENFSSQDFRVDAYWNVDGYLGTPSGHFLYHDRWQRVTRLGTVAH